MVICKQLNPEDVDRAYQLESAGYPADEAATLDALRSRQQVASHLFYGAYDDEEDHSLLVGFICATATDQPTLTHESMSIHVDNGHYVAIHSVCVDQTRQHQKIGSTLIQHFINELKQQTHYKGIILIAHDHLIQWYSTFGFNLVGESKVVHGKDKWFEMFYPLTPSSSSSSTLHLNESENSNNNIRNPGQGFDTIQGGLETLTNPNNQTNTQDLYCPRPECRCLLLKAGTAKLVRSHKNDFELPELPRPVNTQPLKQTQSNAYWSVDSPLSFENIGFSRNTTLPINSTLQTSSTTSEEMIKYLICADCDLGPLGWHDTQGKDLGFEVEQENHSNSTAAVNLRKGREFLLHVERVRYKMM
ncbi:hypothetical protein OIO90_001566 [Microbotryomycetes sp. JL221]|nr:hypothetical protein OIO90_001566 [Microbotryomycetes sp. JL221]